LFRLIFGIASDLLRSRVTLEAEILVLRQCRTVVDAKTRQNVRADILGVSVDSATNSDPWSDDSSASNRTCDDRSAACANTACPVHTPSADHGVRFGCRQGNEAAY
jgi:hypothetical protein